MGVAKYTVHVIHVYIYLSPSSLTCTSYQGCDYMDPMEGNRTEALASPLHQE